MDEEDIASEQEGPLSVDQHGFVVAAGGNATLPGWQVDQNKQMQRLRKWRNMLGDAPLSNQYFFLLLLVHPGFHDVQK